MQRLRSPGLVWFSKCLSNLYQLYLVSANWKPHNLHESFAAKTFRIQNCADAAAVVHSPKVSLTQYLLYMPLELPSVSWVFSCFFVCLFVFVFFPLSLALRIVVNHNNKVSTINMTPAIKSRLLRPAFYVAFSVQS